MGYTIPTPVKQYVSANPLPVIPSKAYTEPREGKCFIPVPISWTGDGATLQINIAGTSAQTFTQIVMMDVDNTESGADVTFFFPDTTDTLLVPAGTGGLFPVFTNALGFYVAAPASLASDQTFIRVLNYRQEPIANPTSPGHSVAFVNGIDVNTATTNIIPAGTEGTLTGYSVFVGGTPGAAFGEVQFSLIDHATGSVLDRVTLYCPANTPFIGFTSNVVDCFLRFKGGVDLVSSIIAGAFSGVVSVNARYKQP